MKNKKILKLSLASGLLFAAVAGVLFTQNVKGPLFATAGSCTHDGEVKHHSEVAPTLVTSGVQEYWACCKCHKSFKDEELTQPFENTSGDPTDPSDGRYAAPLGRTMPENIMYDGSESTAEAPASYVFDKVFQQSGKQGQFIFNETYPISAFAKVSFCVKAGVWFILRNSWDTAYGPDSWKRFELVQTNNNVWSIYSADEGKDLQLKYSDISGKTIKEVTAFGGEASTYYITNLRVTLKDIERDQIVVESAVPNYVEYDDDISIFEEFTTVTKSTVTYNDSNQGQTFLNNINISSFDEVSFGMRVLNRKFCDSSWLNTLKIGEWYKVVITENNGKYDSKVSDFAGNLKFTYTGKDTFAKALPYYNNDGDKKPEAVIFTTEVRGTRKATKVDEYALGGNNCPVQVSTLAAPIGFTQVGEYSVGTAEVIHGQYYSDVSLQGKSIVKFALRSNGWFYFNSWSVACGSDTWMYFILKDAGNDKWDLTVTLANNTVKFTATGLDGYKSSEPGVYTNYALNAILYGCPSTGYFAGRKDGVTNLTIYATEIIAE